MAKRVIDFYDISSSNTFFLGNFFPCSVPYKGRNYQCSEAAFQSEKFAGHPDVFAKFDSADGEEAFQLSRRHRSLEASDWLHRRVDVMRDVLRAKFDANPDLKQRLLDTGDAYLNEHVPVIGRDAFWGDDGDGSGKNTLGHLLMELRGTYGSVGVVAKPQVYQ